MKRENRQVLLVRRPAGAVTPDCFELTGSTLPELLHGDVLVRNVYLSCDPYMRGRMGQARSYASAFELNQVVPARVVGVIEESRNDAFAVGTLVWGFLGWESFTVVSAARGLHVIDDSIRPISHAISVMGMPGLTADVGMMDIGRPVPGQTVFVSAAAGAVGQIAGQLARLAGARVVGSVGSERKRLHLTEKLGFDAAFNYRETPYAQALDALCPDGIDVYFENVGGAALEAVMPRLAVGARVPVCGLISRYGAAESAGLKSFDQLLLKRAVMTGFIVYDHMHKMPAFAPRMRRLLDSGSLVYYEDIAQGLENTPAAFIAMLNGENLGKRLVQISADPTH